MLFIEFIKSLPIQSDEKVNSFINWAKMQNDFPTTNNPIEIGEKIYNKLNHKMTTGFQKSYMIFSHFHPTDIPKSIAGDQRKSLEAINHIVSLQNADKNYRDF